MPNIKSAKKRVKVIATKTARNKANKSALRTAIKKAFYAIDTNADNKQEAVRLATKKRKSKSRYDKGRDFSSAFFVFLLTFYKKMFRIEVYTA